MATVAVLLQVSVFCKLGFLCAAGSLDSQQGMLSLLPAVNEVSKETQSYSQHSKYDHSYHHTVSH